jgi:hypothetical protein
MNDTSPAPQTDPAPVDQGHEIAYLLALLAVLWPSFIGPAPDPDLVGYSLLVVALPTGHCRWLVSSRDLDLFAHVLPMPAEGMPGFAGTVDLAETYRRVFDLTIGRISIAEQAAGVRAAFRSWLRGALEPVRQLVNTSDGPTLYVPWSEVEAALDGALEPGMRIETPVRIPAPPGGVTAGGVMPGG